MKKSEIVTAAVAALLNGTIAVDAFADHPEETIHMAFGVSLDEQSIDQIGREFEIILAETTIRELPGGSSTQRAPGRAAPQYKFPRGPQPKGPGGVGIENPTLDDDGPVYRCLTCT